VAVSLRVTQLTRVRDQLKQVLTDAGFAIELEDVRSYAPPTPEAPPETQLFLLAQRT
jgi:hypothetical protein